jgi:threonine-phosphate decarboxylase
MTQDLISKGMSACSHGGIYSVDPKLVRVDCSSSINPLGISRKAISAIEKDMRVLATVYPDPECRELKNNISHYLHVDPQWISVGNGAVEIIYWFVQAFAKRRVVIPAPTFCEYEHASYKAGADITFVPLEDFELNADTVIEKAKGANAIFLCNPNNPTGILATKQIIKIIENVDRSTKILLDECFIELTDDDSDNNARNSIIYRISEFDNLVILRSLTKSFALAGLRVGYSICNPAIVEKLAANRIPWNVNGLAQAAAVAALHDTKHLAKARALINKEHNFLYNKIQQTRSFTAHRSDSNYFMVNLHGRNSTRFRNTLLKKTGVLVRDCSTFTGMDSHHIRIAIRTHMENLQLLKALDMFDDG